MFSYKKTTLFTTFTTININVTPYIPAINTTMATSREKFATTLKISK